MSIDRGADGFYHPGSEQELVRLVRMAYDHGLKLRVRGAAHSVAHAIYTDPLAGVDNRANQQIPPHGENLNVMLDRYAAWRVRSEERKLVEADAGIHLGADPLDPTGRATLERSLLWQLWHQKQWTLSDTGGITHQTVSGFTATGSAGGSLQFSANQNLWGFRVIDGKGEIYELSVEDEDPDAFYSMSPHLGLLGVVSKITFRCVDTFNISGQEAITKPERCSIDLFGAGSTERPSLERFLRETEYARVEWWPQRGAERVLAWQCRQIAPEPDFKPIPYREFTDHPEVAELFISILYTILGNLDDLSQAKPKLEAVFEEVDEELAGELHSLASGLGWIGDILAKFLSGALRVGVGFAIDGLEPFGGRIEREIPKFFPKLLNTFITLDSEKQGAEKNQPQRFQDWAWHGLPMDNEASDVFIPTEFMEMWVPLGRTHRVMEILSSYFTEPEDDHEAYRRTGTSAWELYSELPSPFWLNPSYTRGDDEWKDGAFRIDAYWFVGNAGDPVKTFYPQFWQLLRGEGIPLRLHWGKFQPRVADDPSWVGYLRAQYPRWEDFLRLREERDPHNVFLNGYWRDHLGL